MLAGARRCVSLPGTGNEVQQAQGQLPLDGPESDQSPFTAGVVKSAGAPGHRQLLRGRPGSGVGLERDGAARQPEYAGAVGQDRVRGHGDDRAGERVVAARLECEKSWP